MNGKVAQSSLRSGTPRLIFGDRWEFDPAPETTHPAIRENFELFIDNHFFLSEDGRSYEAVNPATEKPICRVPLAGARDIDKAYAAAQRASTTVWRKTSPRQRGKYLFRIARLLQDRAREFAVAESLDTGKPVRNTRDFDLPLASAVFFYYAGWADKLEYVTPGRRLEAVGVAGQILSPHSPLLTLARKLAPALAAGNSVVLKPSEMTPVTCFKFADLVLEAGLPPGVVNIVGGNEETDRQVAVHPAAARLDITAGIIPGVKGGFGKIRFDRRGCGVNLIFGDAPLDQAVDGVVSGAFCNPAGAGAGSLVLVQEPLIEEVIDKIKARMAVIRAGDPLDRNTDVGPLVSLGHKTRFAEMIALLESEGAPRHESPCSLPDRGYFCRPTLFAGAGRSHAIERSDCVGPVLAVLGFRTPNEALEKANSAGWIPGAGVWTGNASLIQKMSGALRAEVLWANAFNKFDSASSFGGKGSMQPLFEYTKPG